MNGTAKETLHQEYDSQQEVTGGGKYRVITVWYDRCHDILEDNIARHNKNTSVGDPVVSGGGMGGYSWLGCANGQGVLKRVANGWPEGRAKAESMAEELDIPELKEPVASVIERKRKRRRGDFGNEVDIHRVNQGHCDTAWERIVKVNKTNQSKAVTLFINTGGLSEVQFDQSMWRAAATLAIYKLLSRAGRSVRVVVGSIAQDVYPSLGQHYATTAAVVKDFQEPLDIDKLAAMANIGYHRVFNFRARLCHSKLRCSNYMGRTVGGTEILPYPLLEDKETRGIPVVNLTTCLSRSQAQFAVESVVRQLKLQLEKGNSLSVSV